MNWTKEFIQSWWSWRRSIDKVIGTLDPTVVGTILQRLAECEAIVNSMSDRVTNLETKVGTGTLITEAQTLIGAVNEIVNLLGDKVDKVDGMGLSHNDFTNALLEKLNGIQSGAEVNVQADWDESDTDSDAYIKNKPNIAEQVQADWDESNTSSKAYIKNKPTIPQAPVQSNWNESDSSSLAYIQNKPTIPQAQVQSDWNESDTSSKAYIQNKPTIPQAQVQSDWNESDTSSKAYIQNKPTITSQVQANWNESDTSSKAYIQNKPTIPQAQVQSDWNESDTSSKAYIQNKPNVPFVGYDSVEYHSQRSDTLGSALSLCAVDTYQWLASKVQAGYKVRFLGVEISTSDSGYSYFIDATGETRMWNTSAPTKWEFSAIRNPNHVIDVTLAKTNLGYSNIDCTYHIDGTYVAPTTVNNPVIKYYLQYGKNV